ncbi:hypothetical protein SEMRO_4494_G354130.1 [Seminavis robusta]|uniref:Uncharacterized protein n=1 Tax=Seminavis robusta TaxID=568900 RepID=A0A9N8HZY6_9STRA|nr:hypothetical protein SEMRO_4494_G354130.1 [Seminavis robusta]|eukprot:Sro4494_g354130.1 n/a (219) ;mRNA; f:168-891
MARGGPTRGTEAPPSITGMVPASVMRDVLQHMRLTNRELTQITASVSVLDAVKQELSGVKGLLQVMAERDVTVPVAELAQKAAQGFRQVASSYQQGSQCMEERIAALEKKVIAKMKDATTDMKRHTTQKCTVVSDQQTMAGPSNQKIMDRLVAQDSILNHMDNNIDKLEVHVKKTVHILDTKCPHSNLKSPPAAALEGIPLLDQEDTALVETIPVMSI